MKKPRRNFTKYNNIKVKTEDGTFDSKGEYKRWCQLKIMERVGEINGLVRQPMYEFSYGGTKICKYIADFFYIEANSGNKIIEDFKGVRTGVYKLKKKMMKAFYDIEILETGYKDL